MLSLDVILSVHSVVRGRLSRRKLFYPMTNSLRFKFWDLLERFLNTLPPELVDLYAVITVKQPIMLRNPEDFTTRIERFVCSMHGNATA